MRDHRLIQWIRASAQITTFLGLVIIGVIWSSVYFLGTEERERANQDAIRLGSNLTHVFAEYISRVIRSTDSQLITLRKLYQRDPDNFSIENFIDDRIMSSGLALHFSIIGPDGVRKFSSLRPVQMQADVSDFDSFSVHTKSKTDELYISEPRISRISGMDLIQLTRPIFAPDGSFAGIIAASLDVRALQTFYSAIDLGPGGVISLVGFDGIIRIRGAKGRGPDRWRGQKLSNSRLFELYRDKPTGSFWNSASAAGQLDGVHRLINYRVIEGLPLIAIVGMSDEDIFQQADLKMQDYRQVALCLTAFVLIAIGIGMARRKKLLAATAELERSKLSLEKTNAWFNAAIESMVHGLCMFDRDWRLLVCNKRYADMYGHTLDEIRPGTTVRALFEARLARGLIQNDGNQFVERSLKSINRSQPHLTNLTLADGHIFEIDHQPMPGGGWVAIHQDVTDRRSAEQELDRTKRFLDTIVEHIPMAVVVKDPRTQKFILVNKAYEDLMGIPRERAIGSTVFDMFQKEHAETIAKYDDEVLQSNDRVIVSEFPLELPSKETRIVTTTRLLVCDSNKQPQYLISVIEDSTNRKKSESQISFMAHHDLLTGLANRALFLENIRDAGDQLRQRGEAFTVFMLDLDRFKDVNDSLGHHTGDLLLKEAARRLRSALRETDTLARLGGDEFAIIQASEDDQREAAIALAIRIIDSLNEPFEFDGHKLSIGTSIGIALAPEDGTEPDELMKKSDMALYRAKADGRNIYAFFDPAMTAQADARHHLENDLRRAIAGNELELHYQPVIDVKTLRLCEVEALVRWRHPKKGLISPLDFIPLAEDTGLIIPLGEWVLQQACKDAMTWPPHVKVAVNLSPGQFKKGNLLDVILCVLVESGLPPRRLELEITESVLFENEGRNVTMMHQLKNLGISIALDDFGTGYSSLSYLTMFPFDKIKIDKSFTLNMTRDPTSAAIIAAVLSLGRSLDIATTAEGVETWPEFQSLRVSGVNFVQGFLFSRPRPAAELVFDKIYDQEFINSRKKGAIANVA